MMMTEAQEAKNGDSSLKSGPRRHRNDHEMDFSIFEYFIIIAYNRRVSLEVRHVRNWDDLCRG